MQVVAACTPISVNGKHRPRERPDGDEYLLIGVVRTPPVDRSDTCHIVRRERASETRANLFFSTFYLLSDRVNRRIFSVRHVPTAIDRYNTHSAAAHVPISVHPSVLPTTDTCNPNLTFQRYRPIVQYPCRLCLGIAVVNCVTFQTDS